MPGRILCPEGILQVWGPVASAAIVPNPFVAGRVDTIDITAKIYTPSPRLSCHFSIAFEVGTATVGANSSIAPPTNYGTAQVLGANGVATNKVGGRRAKSFTQLVGRALPFSYELDSNYSEYEFRIRLRPPNYDGVGAFRVGDWVISAEWEPNMCIPPDELCQMLDRCDLTVPQNQYFVLGIPS